MTLLNFSVKQLSRTFKLQKELSKTKMNHEDVLSDTWKDMKPEFMVYVKNDVLCTASSYAR